MHPLWCHTGSNPVQTTNFFKMNFKLTKHYQYSKHCKDGKDRNFIIYFLNGIEIFKQKIPFNSNYEHGFDRMIGITDEYILNSKIYQTRYKHEGCGSEPKNIRNVSFPLSKKRLNELNVPNDIKITI